MMQRDNSNRRVLFLTDGLANGGAERQLALLVKYLPPQWESRIISLGDGPFVQVLRAQGARVDLRLRRWWFDIFPSMFVWRVIADWRPGIVHGWGWMGLAAAMPLCAVLRISTIGTIRTGKVRVVKGHWGGRIHNSIVRRTSRVIVNSQFGMMTAEISNTQGRVICNGFDPDRLKLCIRTNGSSRRPFNAIMVARMDQEKDYATFFATARQLVSQNKQSVWRFTALGSGTLREQWIKVGRDLVEKNALAFPNAGIEVLPQVCDADVGVLMTTPGIAEGCSNAIMEYMACGLPVVCSDSGGNRELVLDGETGFIIPPRDVNALVEKLTWLKEHPAQAARMGQAGRQRILTHFSVEQMVEKTLAVYREMLHVKKPIRG
ncbi:MAG: glycosyltransferase family 4 protein [Chloroflexi bacterium]|nr:glycosyltransferase family 4 protein [Chloroflexota bacterium]